MKQTTNYQFNLIESNDTFSPYPLNENMEKVEAALADLNTDLSGQIAAAMTAIGSGGATARIACGSYTGDGTYGLNNPKTFTFGFKPMLFAVFRYEGRTGHIFIRGMTESAGYLGAYSARGVWGDNSFSFYGSDISGHCNINGSSYYYLAIGI